ncbi:MAG: cytochrome c biogenesis protein CcdA [Planctomycetota bacterium]
MEPQLLDAAAALGLGLLMAVHPCPLAINLAALCLVTGWGGSSRRALLCALAYTAGLITTYLTLGLLAARALGSIDAIAYGANLLLGPLLILAGMLSAGLIRLPGGTTLRAHIGARLGERRRGLVGAYVFGVLLALAFCPASAALFLGTLIPMVVASGGAVILPICFAIGSGLPVLVLAALISGGSRWVERLRDGPTGFSQRLAHGSGYLLIAVGLYLTMIHVFAAP